MEHRRTGTKLALEPDNVWGIRIRLDPPWLAVASRLLRTL
jgi:hypothetical protein